MTSKAKPVLNTLSALRPRNIDTKVAKLGDLTFLLDRKLAELSKSSNPVIRNKLKQNKDVEILEKMASKPPTLTAVPLSRTRRQFPESKSDTDKLNTSRSRLRRTPLPDPTRMTKPATESYTRPISSLDKLAAQSGVDSSVDGIRKRRGYQDRIAERGPTTRFSLPSKTGSRPMRRTARPGQSERRPNKGQEEAAARQQKLQDRQNAARPDPIPYNFTGLEDEFESVLSKLKTNGGKSSYAQAIKLQEVADPTRLVVANRSIVRKMEVLKKIETWIPHVTHESRPSI